MKRLLLNIILLTSFIGQVYSQEDTLFRQVSSHEELDLREVGLLAIPTQGVFIMEGNRLSSIDAGNNLSDVTFTKNIYVNNIIWSGEDFIVRSGNEIFLLDDFEEPLMVFETTNYEIFANNSEKIYVVSHSEDTSILFVGEINQEKVCRLLKIGEYILQVSALKEGTMVVTTENVYLFTEKECKRYLNFWAPVHSAVMTSRGLVFATEDMVCLLAGEGMFVPLFEAKTRQLLYDYKELFLLLDNGDLWAFDIDKWKMQ